MNIRKAENRDLNFISDVCLDNDKIYKEIMPNAFKKQAKKYLDFGLPKTYELYIISVNGRDIGFLGQIIIDENSTYIVALYILSGYQKRGYGRKIINEIIVRNKTKRIMLLVHENAEWAIKFYDRIGFEIVGKSKDDMINYEKKFNKYYIAHTIMMAKEIIF